MSLYYNGPCEAWQGANAQACSVFLLDPPIKHRAGWRADGCEALYSVESVTSTSSSAVFREAINIRQPTSIFIVKFVLVFPHFPVLTLHSVVVEKE